MIWLVRLWLAIVSIRSSMVNGGLETQWIYTLYYTRFASQLEQIYVNVSIRLLIICKRQVANLWQTFMADHHFFPAPVRTTIAIARLYLKIVRPFGRKWMKGGYSVLLYIFTRNMHEMSRIHSVLSLQCVCLQLAICLLMVETICVIPSLQIQ